MFLCILHNILHIEITRNTSMTNNLAPSPQYLRPAKAAVYLQVTRSTIYRLMSEKKLKSYLVGGTRLLKTSDIDALVEQGAQ
jgi:excisionase family DNA binding protein